MEGKVFVLSNQTTCDTILQETVGPPHLPLDQTGANFVMSGMHDLAELGQVSVLDVACDLKDCCTSSLKREAP